MPKIMLVEDDNNLREIYGERLIAEGYEIVSASDGEEALALAIKERPDLIISDIMMPKISGFDMLDILRQTPETKDTKVVMMTALSQTEDKARASKLGADKYLVKSQVTLEDVARVVHELLDDKEPQVSNKPTVDTHTVASKPLNEPVATPPPAQQANPEPKPTTIEVKEEPDMEVATPPAEESIVPPPSKPVATPPPAQQAPQQTPPPSEPQQSQQPTQTETPPSTQQQPQTDNNNAISTNDEISAISKQINNFANNAKTAETKQVPVTEKPNSEVIEPASARKKVIEPINNPAKETDINELYKKEMANENTSSSSTSPNQPGQNNPNNDDPNFDQISL